MEMMEIYCNKIKVLVLFAVKEMKTNITLLISLQQPEWP